ncbi:MAG: hypothetical protein E7050_11220 [Lentisphaerae bacterium]|nr:hypothetical protein [Lentisphaerota bacterium]
MLTRKKIFLTVAATAIFTRIIFAIFFHYSYFENYHLVPGLDMQTLLRFSEWGNGEDSVPFFTFHRLIIFLIWIIAGKTHCVWAVFTIQTLTGITGCLCMTDIVRKLSRSRIAALVCGIAGALYMPFMVYEFSILQETFMVNFALFAFWTMLNALHKRFSIISSILFAASVFAALAGRPAAIFWCGAIILFSIFKMYRRKMLKKLIFPMSLLIALLAGAAIFNKVYHGWFSPFYNVLPYTMQYNAEVTTINTGTPQQPSIIQSSINAVSRIPRLFKYGEIPENHNIYFWCEKIPELNFLPGPALIVPLGVAGIMILLCSGEFKHRYGLLLLPVITLALPLCAREVIGRYRLMLIPYFLMSAACAAVIFGKIKTPRKRGLALLGAGIGAFFSIHNGDVPLKVRASDYSAWAMAIESTPGSDPELIIDAYIQYWEYGKSERAFRMTVDKALHYSRFSDAFAVCQQAENFPAKINPDLIEYYYAWCFAMINQPENVEKHLRNIKNVHSLPPDARKNAFMLRDKTVEILKKLDR